MNPYDDIMNPTGKKNKIILSQRNVFSNASCMFIEYNDVINAPYYTYILSLIRTGKIDEYFNIPIDSKNIDFEYNLFKWYTNRKFINPFFSIGVKKSVNDIIRGLGGNYEDSRAQFLNEYLFKSMNDFPDIIRVGTHLNFAGTLKKIISIHNLVNKIIVYCENYHEGIKDDLIELYGDNVTYVSGDLIEILSSSDIPKDSTYVFSDVNKVYALKDTDRLNGAAILISDKFGYNYNNEDKLLLDTSLFMTDTFILNTFDNIHNLVYE